MRYGRVSAQNSTGSLDSKSQISFLSGQRVKVASIAMILSLSASAFTYAASSPQELVSLRSDVDDLASELEVLRSGTRAELARLRAERDSLQRRVKRARAEKAAAANQSRKRKDELAKLQEQGKVWLPPFRSTIEQMKEHVRTSIPFQRAARLDELTRIEQQLDGAHPDLVAIAEELWRLIEQEEALGRQVGVGRQAAEIDGKRLLVEVVRLANALVYFKTPTGEFGLVEQKKSKGESKDEWKIVSDEASRLLIKELFDRAIRGEYLGPNRLLIPASAVKK